MIQRVYSELLHDVVNNAKHLNLNVNPVKTLIEKVKRTRYAVLEPKQV